MTISSLKNLKTIVKLESPQKSIESSPCKHQCKDKSKCKHICCKSPVKVSLGEMKDNSPNKSTPKSPHFLMGKQKKTIVHDDEEDLDLPDEFFEDLESKGSQRDSTQTWKQKYGISTTSNDVKFNTKMKNNLNEMNSSKPIIPVTKLPSKVEFIPVGNVNKSNIVEVSKPIIPVTKNPKETPIIPVTKIPKEIPIIPVKRNPMVNRSPPIPVTVEKLRNVEKKEIPKFEKASTLNSKKIELGELKETLSKKGMNPMLLDLDFDLELDDCSDLINEFL
jgi:hypothetical protein